MKTFIITATIVVLLIIGVKYFVTDSNNTANRSSKSVNTSEVSEGNIVIENNNIELGDMPINGGKVESRFSFKNEGSEPVTIKKGETSCMCTEAVVEKSDGTKSQRLKMSMGGGMVAGVVNMTIEPGETMTLVGIFDPMAHGPSGVGSINRDITLHTNSKTNSEVRFSFSGNVIQ